MCLRMSTDPMRRLPLLNASAPGRGTDRRGTDRRGSGWLRSAARFGILTPSYLVEDVDDVAGIRRPAESGASLSVVDAVGAPGEIGVRAAGFVEWRLAECFAARLSTAPSFANPTICWPSSSATSLVRVAAWTPEIVARPARYAAHAVAAINPN